MIAAIVVVAALGIGPSACAAERYLVREGIAVDLAGVPDRHASTT